MIRNREFKYRYWDTATGNWEHKFHYFELENKRTDVIGLTIIGIDRPDRYIIQEYTGLKDSNGKEIYEGDIMASRGNYRTNLIDKDGNNIDIYSVVVWNKESTRFALKPINKYLRELKNPINPELDHPWVCKITAFKEVVGNICENPDMLEKLLEKQNKDEEKARKELDDMTSECDACGENAVIDGMCGHCGYEER